MTRKEYETKVREIEFMRAQLDVEYINSILSKSDITAGDIFHIKEENCIGEPQWGYTEYDVVACSFQIDKHNECVSSIRCSLFDNETKVTFRTGIMGEPIDGCVKYCHILNDSDIKVGHIELPANLIKVYETDKELY